MNWYRAGLALLLAFVPFALSLGAAPQTRPASLLDWSPLWPFGLRSVPSESMAPALWPGDRVSVYYLAYAGEKSPKRGDVVIFHHPHNPRVMIKRVIGLSGDTIEMRGGRLILNGREVERKRLREVTYLSDFNQLFQATEYSEQLPGEERPHLTYEFSDDRDLDETPIFRIPPGHLFMMGDNRDNSEDSRAPTGHARMAEQFPEAWPLRLLKVNFDPRDNAIGFVPETSVIARATAVVFSLHLCLPEQAAKTGAECPAPRIGKPL
jgi:signal peptidase I